MVKLSGGSRTLTGGSREYSRREVEFNQLRNSGRYSSGYFSDKGGGYVLVERSSMPHEKDEIEAAMYLADKGYIVTLMDESNKDRGSKVKTPDGIGFVTEISPLTGMCKVSIHDKGVDIIKSFHRDKLTVIGKRSRGDKGKRNEEGAPDTAEKDS